MGKQLNSTKYSQMAGIPFFGNFMFFFCENIINKSYQLMPFFLKWLNYIEILLIKCHILGTFYHKIQQVLKF
jgi:hypothetical protein